jgi:tol-pal system protein YbgF
MVSLEAFNWRGRSRSALAAAMLLLAASAAGLPAHAEQTSPAPDPKAQGSEPVASRIGRLESQFVDLQVMIGTLESLLRAKPGTVLPQERAAAAPEGDALAPRVKALETQIGALAAQLERIGRQLGAIEARLSDAPQQQPWAEPPPDEVPPFRQGHAPAGPWDNVAAPAEGDGQPRWYGPRPGEDDDDRVGAIPDDSSEQSPSITAALPSADPHSLYQQGYGELLQRDYPAAEVAFRQFLVSYPNDPLAGNAQYWLGETYFARGAYKSAADAFLKGYERYKSSDKTADSLLRLGMSLAALGQKEAACSTFGELGVKFPRAPETLRDEAKSERAKAGC